MKAVAMATFSLGAAVFFFVFFDGWQEETKGKAIPRTVRKGEVNMCFP